MNIEINTDAKFNIMLEWCVYPCEIHSIIHVCETQLVGLPEVFDLHRGGVLFYVRHLTNNDIFNKLNVHYKCVMVSIEFFETH